MVLLRLLYLCSRIRRQVSGIVASNTHWFAGEGENTGQYKITVIPSIK